MSDDKFAGDPLAGGGNPADPTNLGPQPPRETVDDPTRQLRDLIEQRLDDYLELMVDSARALDRREVDAKMLLENSSALFEFLVRDATWWWRQAVQNIKLPADVGLTESALSIDVPIKAPSQELTLACSGLRHAQFAQHTIPQHAIAVAPNPVKPGTPSVEVAFDPFGKPAGAYVGKLVAWTTDPSDGVPYGDVIFYVGGNNQRF